MAHWSCQEVTADGWAVPKGGLRAKSREQGGGRCLAPEKAIPGMPPSLTQGRMGSTGVVSGIAATQGPFVCGSAGSWGALGASGHLYRP